MYKFDCNKYKKLEQARELSWHYLEKFRMWRGNKGPLTESRQIRPLFDKLLQLSQATKAELFSIYR